MTAEQLHKLSRCHIEWCNGNHPPKRDSELCLDVMEAIPDVLAHIKAITAERDAALKACSESEKECERLRLLVPTTAQAMVYQSLLNRFEASEKACAEMRDALCFWNEMYPKELAKAEKEVEFCKKENDTHGVNFHSGLRAGLISHDIFLSRFKHALSSDCGKGYVPKQQSE